jgi:serine/threonine protein phosphatase PrpC
MFRNVILQALGAQNELTPATAAFSFAKGDMLLLCSDDGLSGKLRNEFGEIVFRSGDLGSACAAWLLKPTIVALENNITVAGALYG